MMYKGIANSQRAAEYMFQAMTPAERASWLDCTTDMLDLIERFGDSAADPTTRRLLTALCETAEREQA